jgi:hypothetical protein
MRATRPTPDFFPLGVFIHFKNVRLGKRYLSVEDAEELGHSLKE